MQHSSLSLFARIQRDITIGDKNMIPLHLTTPTTTPHHAHHSPSPHLTPRPSPHLTTPTTPHHAHHSPPPHITTPTTTPHHDIFDLRRSQPVSRHVNDVIHTASDVVVPITVPVTHNSVTYTYSELIICLNYIYNQYINIITSQRLFYIIYSYQNVCSKNNFIFSR